MLQPTQNDIVFQYSEAQEHIFFGSRPLGRFRFFPKGRRLGATRGAAHAFIERMLDGDPCLWGDTTHGNIERYVARYFVPALKKNGITYNWNAQKNLMTCGERGGYTDFRSADRPENWEGFGYKLIFLNEAGIILDDAYLYNNAVLPMLMDYTDSELIAAGTPKLRQGVGRLFKELCDKGLRNEKGYYTRRFSSFDNPFIDRSAVDTLAREIEQTERRQEIFGEFLEPGGEMVQREHLRYAVMPEKKAMFISMAADLAIGKKETADYTACVVFGQEQFGQQRKFVLDAQRRRVGFHGALAFINSMAEKWGPQTIGIEKVQYQAAVSESLFLHTSLPIVEVVPDKDKVRRFQPLAARYQQGMIHHAQDQSGTNLVPKEYEDEVLAFPGGDHDDQVDAGAYAHALLPNTLPLAIGTSGPRESAAPTTATPSGWGTMKSNNSMRGFV